MTYGVSYWGRNPKRARRDGFRLAAMGFSWVLVPVSEERMAFDRDGTREVIRSFFQAGLEVRVSPWGVARLFGGEGLSSAPVGRWAWQYEHAAEWTKHALTLGADGIYWDEPKGPHGMSLVERLSESVPLPQHLYWNAVLAPPPGRVAGRMTTIGIDAYDDTTEIVAVQAAALAEQWAVPVHVWVRAFGLTAEQRHKPGCVIGQLRRAGVDSLAVWGYPAPGVSVLNCERPRETWRGIAEAMAA